MRLTMIGAGYVGLVSGACFADFGHVVTCVDVNENRIRALKNGDIPIFEPDLDRIVATNVAEGRLSFTTDLAGAVSQADAVFIAVGTPSRRGDGHADLTYVDDAAQAIASALDGFTVVVTKSTVPVGTGDRIEAAIRAARPDADIAVVSNPEFMREGAAIDDFKRPNRIVVGTTDPRGREVMSEIYRPLYLNQAPLLFTDRRSAELIKYASNAFLATKITFINEMADLCEKLGADVQDIARGMGLDNRIGPKFLHPGPGFGGSCFPKDTLALIRTAEEAGAGLRIVSMVNEINEARKTEMADRVVEALGGSAKGRTVALLGLTFKPNTDDMREAPSLSLVPPLQAAGASLRAFDPQGMDQAAPLFSGVNLTSDPYACATGADALVLVTEWESFRALDLKRLKSVMNAEPVLVDLRNIYPPAEVRSHGFAYRSIGRPLLDRGEIIR
ncbi:MAG: UDP-glucose/GDP-mannose dehydrogenase family protein [Hyphomicrobiales bacterium]|nr:UDP-glucose/GDP-mannose dehydrogenase family protein [Hyphomicrobiales bacterium]